MLRSTPITSTVGGARRVTNGVAANRRCRPPPSDACARGAQPSRWHAEDGGHAMKTTWLRSLCGAGALWAAILGLPAGAAHAESFDVNEDNLLVVLRETPGANKQD